MPTVDSYYVLSVSLSFSVCVCLCMCVCCVFNISFRLSIATTQKVINDILDTWATGMRVERNKKKKNVAILTFPYITLLKRHRLWNAIGVLYGANTLRSWYITVIPENQLNRKSSLLTQKPFFG